MRAHRLDVPRESLTSFFVSSISEPGVAVNLGGACGGFWYLAGAIVAVVSGRTEVNVAEESFEGVRWPTSDVRRVLMRPDARMRVMETKRKAAVRASLRSRGDARMEEEVMGYGCRERVLEGAAAGYCCQLRLWRKRSTVCGCIRALGSLAQSAADRPTMSSSHVRPRLEYRGFSMRNDKPPSPSRTTRT